MKTSYIMTALLMPLFSLQGGTALDVVPSRQDYNDKGMVTLALPVGGIPALAPMARAQALHLTFTTDRHGVGSGLPTGWNMPFFNACVYEVSESMVRALLPNGISLDFRRDVSGGFMSAGDWLLEQSADRVKITSRSGEQIKFVAGRITEWRKAGAPAIAWRYDGQELREVTRNEHRLFSLKHESNGPQRVMTVKGDSDNQFRIFYSKVVSADISAALREQHLTPDGIDRVELSNGDVLQMELDEPPGSEVTRLLVKQNREKVLKSLSWNRVSGVILNSGDRKIQVDQTPLTPLFVVTQPLITEQVADAQPVRISNLVEERDGLVREYLPDGTVKQTSQIFTPTGAAIRKIVHEGDSSSEHLGYKARFGSKGEVIHDQSGRYTRKLENGVYNVYLDGKLVRSY